jgi:hypothetical protein
VTQKATSGSYVEAHQEVVAVAEAGAEIPARGSAELPAAAAPGFEVLIGRYPRRSVETAIALASLQSDIGVSS